MSEELDEIRTLLENLTDRVTKLEATYEAKPQVSKKLSAKEFLLEKEVRTDLDKALALGYYLEKYGGLSAFNIDDLVTAFKEAKEPVPGNVNETVNKNVRKGFIMEHGEKAGKKSWVTTSTGEKFVENDMGGKT